MRMPATPARLPFDAGDNEREGLFGPASMTWRIGGETAMLLGGGRAVLMQLAHPLVAAGVGQHSFWSSDLWGRVRGTMELTQQITFGTLGEAMAAARTINRLHTGVTGALDQPAGVFVPGTSYRARDPDLLLWVLATLIDTVLMLYPLLVGALTPDEEERYYAESRRSGALLGLPATLMPPTLAEFRAYMQEMMAGDHLAITPAAREVARVVMRMPAPAVLRPLLAATEQVTVWLLPPRLRELYGFTWDRRRQALLEVWAAGTRRVLPLLPPVARQTPQARAAWRRVRAGVEARRCA
jgi:uncharacterized protein (DUF2236 family)